MGVDHCGSDVLMSEQLLHRVNVIAGFEHMGGKLIGTARDAVRRG